MLIVCLTLTYFIFNI